MDTGAFDRLVTPDLVLRKARADDTRSIWENVWSDGELARNMLWQPTAWDGAPGRMDRTIALQREYPAYFVCLRETDEPIGFCGIRETEEGVFEETGLCIARKCQKRGYGTQMLRALVSLAFDGLGGHRFVYECFRENGASAALCRKCGFVYSHSEHGVREWDGHAYLCDVYVLDRGGAEEDAL